MAKHSKKDRQAKKEKEIFKLGFRIEGHCSECSWEFVGQAYKECEWCFSKRIYTTFLLTCIKPDIVDTHREEDDPVPRKRYGSRR